MRGLRAFDMAPHVPVAGTSTAAMSNGKLHVDLLLSDDIIALRVTDGFSNTPRLPARAKNPRGV